MILVITGTSSWDFSRLIIEMDRIAGIIDEEIVMQISDTKYEPKNAKYFRFVSDDEFETLFQNARLIVSHAGVGSILSAFRHKKPLIVVPRREKYQEHFDDHQTEIARELENDKGYIVIWDIPDLEKIIKTGIFSKTAEIHNSSLIQNLKIYLEKLKSETV